MPGLTVTEKEHWKDRITRRIDKRIEAVAASEPNLRDRVQREARERARDSLGLAALEDEQERLERETQALERRETQIALEMLAIVRGVPVSDVEPHAAYRHESEVNAASGRRQAVFADELLAQTETGRRILELEQEKDNLLDTVWLATSPS